MYFYCLQSLGVEYERYLREIVTTLEDDESFRKKLEEMNMTDIKVNYGSVHLCYINSGYTKNVNKYHVSFSLK